MRELLLRKIQYTLIFSVSVLPCVKVIKMPVNYIELSTF